MGLPAGFPVALVSGLLVVAGGCGFSGPDGGGQGVVVYDTLESGVVVARNTPPADRYGAPRWVLEEELRIGTLDGAGPDLFGEIKGVEVDDEGRIYILESQAREVRVFGPDGAFLYSFGRQGEGPGEFSRAHGLARAPDGRIWVADHGTDRYSVFEADGRFVTSYRVPFWSFGYLWCCGFGRDGFLYDDAGRDPDLAAPFHKYLRRIDMGGEIVAEHRFPDDPPGYTHDYFSFEAPDGSSGGNMAIPYGVDYRITVDPRGGFLTAMRGRYRIERLGLEGELLGVVESVPEEVAISAAERRAAEERVRGFAEHFGARPDLSRIPEKKPAIMGFFVDDTDRLWVRTSGVGGEVRFDLYDDTGRFLGATRTDLAISEYWRPLVRGNALYTVVTGEFDEEYVVRARLSPVTR